MPSPLATRALFEPPQPVSASRGTSTVTAPIVRPPAEPASRSLTSPNYPCHPFGKRLAKTEDSSAQSDREQSTQRRQAEREQRDGVPDMPAMDAAEEIE